MGVGGQFHAVVSKKKRKTMGQNYIYMSRKCSPLFFYVQVLLVLQVLDLSPNTCHQVCASALAQRSWQGKPCY